ncbi:MAG: VOC family protein [Bdellovibrionota bacterium]
MLDKIEKKFSISGLNHLGLIVEDIAIAREWYCNALGLEIIEDRGEIIFLRAGSDVIAIKTPAMAVAKPEHSEQRDMNYRSSGGWQAMDHYGFFAKNRQEVDNFAAMLNEKNIHIIKGPYDRKDGRSVYFRDPCGNVGEYFFYIAD